MAFPTSPVDGQQHVEGQKNYIYNAAGGAWLVEDVSATGGGATNLAHQASPTGGTITSDTGTNASVPLADGVNAGYLAPADFSKLAGVEAGATADQTATEVPVTPTGNLTSTDVQAALAELQGDVDGLTTSSAADNFIATGGDPLAGDGVDGDYHIALGGGNIGAITGPKAGGLWPTTGNHGNAFSQLRSTTPRHRTPSPAWPVWP